jgi:hypothetical protein
VKDAAGKAKTAALAGGAAAVGLTATVLITRRANKQRKVLGVPLPKRSNGFKPLAALPSRRRDLRRDTRKFAGKVTNAADRADRLGRRVSSVAGGVKEVSKTADEAAKKA